MSLFILQMHTLYVLINDQAWKIHGEKYGILKQRERGILGVGLTYLCTIIQREVEKVWSNSVLIGEEDEDSCV